MKKITVKGKSKNFVLALVIISLICLVCALSAAKSNNVAANAAIVDNQCDGDHTGWIPLPQTGGALSAGNYYLQDNITLDSNIKITTGTVNFCLNGKLLTGAIGSDESIFHVYGSGQLNIYDCNSGNEVHPYKIKEVAANATQDLYYGNQNYSNRLFQRYYDFAAIGDGVIVGGVITGGHKYSSMPDLKDNFSYQGGGSAILIGGAYDSGKSGGTVNMYGGTISGNTVTALSQFGDKRERSGAVCVCDGANFNMYNGAISGNSARFHGAGLFVFGRNNTTNKANARLYSGRISDNYSLDSTYNYSPLSGTDSTGGVATDNISNGSSIVSIEGNPNISNNYGFSFNNNTYPESNVYFSSQTYNVIQITGLLYKEIGGEKQYAKIGLSVDATPSLSNGYTASGNLPEDVNKIFYADLRTRAVAYNSETGEVKYVNVNLKTLTYNANYDGGGTSNISVVDSISVDNVMFARNGYAFSSWNTDSSGNGITYNPGDIITLTANQTLYAQWNKEQYSIDYWLNGGTLSGQKTSYTYGTSYTLPTPINDTYTFDGWYDNAMLSGDAVTTITTTDFGNKTFYAKWGAAISYTITSYSGANGTISPLGSIIYDGTSQDWLITPNSGYKVATFTVDGVDKKSQIINNIYTISDVTSDTIIEVTFEKIVLTDITVYATCTAGGSISPEGYSVVERGGNIKYTIKAQPGYRNSDIQVNGISRGVADVYTFMNVQNAFSIHAIFVSNVSPLVLNKNGGTFAQGYDEPFIYQEGRDFTLPVAGEIIRNNYRFDGWYLSADFSGTAVTKIFSNERGKKEFFAKWTVKQSQITFNKNSGTFALGYDAPEVYQEGVGITLPVAGEIIRQYHTFSGWYLNAEFSGNAVTEILSNETGNKEFFAKWTVNESAITFNTNSGTFANDFDAPEVYQEGVGITLPGTDEIIKEYYVFNGWYRNAEFSGYTVAAIQSNETGNKEFFAKWTVKQSEITYNTNGGTFAVDFEAPEYYQESVGVTLPVTGEIIRQYYTFNGWYLNAAFSGSAVTQILSNETGDKEFFAKWTVNEPAITFNTNSGTFAVGYDAPEVYQEGVGITLPVAGEILREYHIFGGWYLNAEFSGNAVTEILSNETGNKEFFAKWTVKQSQITFNKNSGTFANDFDAPEVYQEGVGITLPVAGEIIREYHIFGGWYLSADFNGDAITEILSNETGNKEFFAKWTVISTQITLNKNGGMADTTFSATCGSALPNFSALSRVGYTLNGYFTTASGDIKVINADGSLVPNLMGYSDASGNWQNTSANITFYAQWSLNAPTISGISGYTGAFDNASHNISASAAHALSDTYTLSFQWYKESVLEENKVGTDNSNYSVINFADSGTYYCKVSIFDGEETTSAISSAITVNITKIDISEAEITLGDILTYNKSEQTQTIKSVVVGGLTATYSVSDNKQTNYSESGYILTINGNGNFSGAATKKWNIAKATYDMSGITFESKTIKADSSAKSIAISGQLPSGVSVRYEGNEKSIAGVYTVTAIFIYDSVNYNAIENKTATLTLLLPEITEKTEDNNTEKPDIVISSEKGFEPDLELIISVIPNDRIMLELGNNTKLAKAYGVRLVRGEEDYDLTDEITIRLLIPNNIETENFTIYSGQNMVNYSIEEGYAVFAIDSLSNLAFVYEASESISLLWLIILLAILLLIEIALAIYKILKDKKDKNLVKTYTFAPLFLAAVLPSGQITAIIILGVLCVLFALFDIYLFLLKDRLFKKQDNKKFVKEAGQEADKEDIINNEIDETAEDLANEEEDEDIEFCREETKNGFAVLIRYRKSFLAKLIQSSDETKNYYARLKNAILSYKKVSSHISFNYDSINHGRKKLVKFNVRGKTLYLYLALNPNDFANSKYKVEYSQAKKYAYTPCLYKIRNDRRAKYALELIELLAKKFGLENGVKQNIDYYLPYQTTEQLIAKGFIKELITKENYEDLKRRQNQADVNSKKRSFVSAGEVNDILLDEVAASLIVEEKKENSAPQKGKTIINIDSISSNYSQGEIVNIQTLHQKGLINSKVKHIKVLARGRLDKALTIEASDFSMEAVKMILITGGKVIKVI